jgi:HPt (histidine-containing phosphotransfer) domain-containing protein
VTPELPVLDREQLRDITMDDPELMREVLAILVDDTTQHVALLAAAVEAGDSERCARLAHYCKGACANVGAKAAADGFRVLETSARQSKVDTFVESLHAIHQQMESLRTEVETLL